MTTAFWADPKTQKQPDLDADVVIVGAGYLGLSTAYWLTLKKPSLKIIILDRGTVGSGASGRNAGFLTMGSAAFYKGLVAKWGMERAIEIHDFAKESIRLAAEHLGLTAQTTSFTFLNEPYENFGFGFKWKDTGYENGPEYKVNPMELLEKLRSKLTKVEILENVSAYKLTANGVCTEVNEIRCKKVLLALNGHLPQFHSTFSQAIVPRRAQMLAVKLHKPLEAPHLHYDPAERVYWRTERDDTLVIGGKRLLDERGEVGDFEKLSPLIQAGLEDYLRTKLGLEFDVLHRWSGTMAFTAHELPYLEKVKAPIEAYVSGGYSGHGMGFGFHAAKELAELLLGERQKSFFSFAAEAGFEL
jgi:gamma-glutamylputrescine oxidase